MGKELLSLNFMYCMERFATQIYRTQQGAYKKGNITQKLTAAAGNEKTHYEKLQAQIENLNGRVYPLGWLFQTGGVALGILTRLSGINNLLKADTFVENRAVKDYNSFLRAIAFDSDTAEMIRKIIQDEEEHIANWRKAQEQVAYFKTPPPRIPLN